MNYEIINDVFINQNNARILSAFKTQPRYVFNKDVKKETNNNKVSDNIKNWLMAVNLYQYKKTLTEIYKLAGFTAGSGSRIAHDCEKRNLIKILQFKIRRGCPKYPVLLPEAYRILGIREKKFYGKGAGYEHILYQYHIAEHFSAYKPAIELNRNNKLIDIAIETNEILLCIEVAITSLHEKENIDRDFSKAKADFVIVACKSEKVLKEVQGILLEMPDQITHKSIVYLISDLLSKKPDELINRLGR